MGWLCRYPGIVVEPIRKQARWATVDWSLHKEWNLCARANFHVKKRKKKKKKNGVGEKWIHEHYPKNPGRSGEKNKKKNTEQGLLTFSNFQGGPLRGLKYFAAGIVACILLNVSWTGPRSIFSCLPGNIAWCQSIRSKLAFRQSLSVEKNKLAFIDASPIHAFWLL